MRAYQPVRQSAGKLMLKPGDQIGGMIITTATTKVPPLWTLCSPALEKDGVRTVDCQVPSLPKLTVGQPFSRADQTLQTLDWSALTWELYLDGNPLDLETFGFYDYVMPDLAPHPSPNREIFRQSKAWDVVLTNAGLHSLHGTARTGANTYTWLVNFTVEDHSIMMK